MGVMSVIDVLRASPGQRRDYRRHETMFFGPVQVVMDRLTRARRKPRRVSENLAEIACLRKPVTPSRRSVSRPSVTAPARSRYGKLGRSTQRLQRPRVDVKVPALRRAE